MKACLMDILPNYHVWTNITKNWVIGTWHWGFMAQPEPFPERLIGAVSAEYYIKSRMMIRGGTGIGFLTDTAINEYSRCFTPKTITGSCRDYRATATCDFEMDTADKHKLLEMPLLLIWGARGNRRNEPTSFSMYGGDTPRTSSLMRRSSAATIFRKRCRRRSSPTSPASSSNRGRWTADSHAASS